MERWEWDGLPGVVRAAVEDRTGLVADVVPVTAGLTCSFAAGLRTSSGRLFVKGVRVGDAAGMAGQRMERVVHPLVQGLSPGLRWRVRAGGWELLGFDWVEGRHAELGPGSSDAALVGEVLVAASAVGVPEWLTVPRLAARLAPHLETAEAALLWGDTLLHTDTNPHNLLVDGARAWLVDWAMPAKGPAWVDAAYTAVRLMEDGTAPVEALEWLEQFPVWREADPAAVAAFVVGTCRAWEAIVGPVDCLPSNRRFEELLAAVRA
ncbi:MULTISPECIES: phosphotransferase [unclassified Streptomyces]|uniref:phosphotransferase n=1 Tax=unclassified Streptomyces TaxID=2593676 RepID=UPI0033C2B168